MVLFTLTSALRLDMESHRMMTPGPPEGKIYDELEKTLPDILERYLTDHKDEECSLCNTDQKWLFIAATGRSGSTTTLNMLQSIPGIHLAGENNGTVAELLKLYKVLPFIQSHGYQGFNGSWGHGPISERSVLCALQDYVEALIGKPAQADPKRIGFKEIRWEEETLDFMLKLFPCAQIVTQTRRNLTQQSQSEFWGEKPEAIQELQRATSLLEAWQRNHTDVAFHMHLEDFSPDRFNALLRWLGVQGCQFKNVCHANPNGNTDHDASSDVQVDGTCSIAT